jgi:hypothetical protein
LRKPGATPPAAEVIIVDAEDGPRGVTVRHVANSLGEHFAGFLAANNMGGWVRDVGDDYVLDRNKLADTIMLFAGSSHQTLNKFSKAAKRLVRAARANGSELKHGQVLDMLARALGHNGYVEAHQARNKEDVIFNEWPRSSGMSLVSLDQEVSKRRVNAKSLEGMSARIKSRDADPDCSSGPGF